MLKRCALIAALSLVLLPASAGADWLFTPAIGSTFGGNAKDREHVTYDMSIGWMGAGVIGWEADIGFTPKFFESSNDSFALSGRDNVLNAMANVLVGVPIGGQRGGGFRPYVTAGVGVLQQKVGETSDAFHVNNSDFGFNAGVGAMGFFSDHVGLRGDLRYLRSFVDPNEDNEFDIGVGKFDFWRGTAGVTFRW